MFFPTPFVDDSAGTSTFWFTLTIAALLISTFAWIIRSYGPNLVKLLMHLSRFVATLAQGLVIAGCFNTAGFQLFQGAITLQIHDRYLVKAYILNLRVLTVIGLVVVAAFAVVVIEGAHAFITTGSLPSWKELRPLSMGCLPTDRERKSP